jgi:hypothetical protein
MEIKHMQQSIISCRVLLCLNEYFKDNKKLSKEQYEVLKQYCETATNNETREQIK